MSHTQTSVHQHQLHLLRSSGLRCPTVSYNNLLSVTALILLSSTSYLQLLIIVIVVCVLHSFVLVLHFSFLYFFTNLIHDVYPGFIILHSIFYTNNKNKNFSIESVYLSFVWKEHQLNLDVLQHLDCKHNKKQNINMGEFWWNWHRE